ncbi:unnamed protein product [Pleuronectes platessa]|uniref:Uncharacterized protein n=1 Tax=Pleuronectes platessa TaxID=8262 RepID=A0A9N7VIU2_PLEPL|nr:unnamed protein product [Pleuronectes platessa]
MMMKYLGLKLGPAVKLCYHIDRLKQNRLGEYGSRLGQVAASGRGGVVRRRLRGGLAGQQDEEEVPGLEEEAAARPTVSDSEEAGSGLRDPWFRSGRSCCFLDEWRRLLIVIDLLCLPVPATPS